jgi:uncharacterized repeat protein (TIGR03806 family)
MRNYVCLLAVFVLGGCGEAASNAGIAADVAGAPDVVVDPCADPVACAAKLGPVAAQPCQLDGVLPQTAGIQLVPRFAKLGLKMPLQVLPWPGPEDQLVAVLRGGQLVRFANQDDVTTSQVLADLSTQVSTAGEGGLLSAAFHPQFAKTRKVYVDWTASKPAFATVVTELTLDESGVAIPALTRELLRLKQPWNNHNGGQLAFDLSGKLLIGLGDGGSGGDPLNAGQDKKNWLGKILRIDVDVAAATAPYSVPADNPFVADPDFAPEIWAWGLRNPWRFSVDRVTGLTWIADVGQNKWEEVDIAKGGENFGWRKMEGNHCYDPNCDKTGLTLPVAEYDHSEGVSITGGVVYRGSQQKSLYGKYLFADYGSGKFWTLRADPDKPGAWLRDEVAQTAIKPVGFGEDRHGEVFVTQLFGQNTVFQVVEQLETAPPVGPAFPQTLSATGCFASLQPLVPNAGLIPYQPHAPLWSDGAVKHRWFGLPVAPVAGQAGSVQVPANAAESWDLPLGSVLVKHFALPGVAGEVPVETRLMHRKPSGWAFYSYRWNQEGTEATWQPGGGGTEEFALGGDTKQVWAYPTSAQCRQCHSQTGSDASQVLGLHSAQVAGDYAFAAGTAPYLQVLSAAGVLAAPLADSAVVAMPTLAEASVSGPGPLPADLATAARALLHSNCAPCHRPGGGAPTDLDLRWDKPLGQTRTCNVLPQNGDFAGTAKGIVVPGQPEASALWLRTHAAPGSAMAMPPVGNRLASQQLQAILTSWIKGLQGCD